MADDKTIAVKDVFAILTESKIKLFCNGCQSLLFTSYGNTFEDAVISATDTTTLIFCKNVGAYTLFEFAIFKYERGARSCVIRFLEIQTPPWGLPDIDKI